MYITQENISSDVNITAEKLRPLLDTSYDL